MKWPPLTTCTVSFTVDVFHCWYGLTRQSCVFRIQICENVCAIHTCLLLYVLRVCVRTCVRERSSV